MHRHDPSEKTKQEILNAAFRLFREKGWDNVNIEDIVKEVGVTRGAFYHYFKSREDLIIAVVDKMFYDNNPFEIASKEAGLNALEKLRLALKLDFAKNIENDGMIDELFKAFDNPVIFKSQFLSQLNTISPYIEKLLLEGNEDGSLSVKYPKQTAQILAILPNFWLSHDALSRDAPHISRQELIDKVMFLGFLSEKLGVPIFDNELKEMLRKFIELFELS